MRKIERKRVREREKERAIVSERKFVNRKCILLLHEKAEISHISL